MKTLAARPSGSRRSVTDAVERFWLDRSDGATFVLVRTFYGCVVFFWAFSLVPDFGRIFGDGGLNPSVDYRSWKIVALFRYVEGEAVFALCLALLLASSLLVIFGRAVRLSLIITVLLQISFAEHAFAWTIGAEKVLRVFGVFLVMYALITPTTLHGKWPGRDGSYGAVLSWPVRLIQLQLALVYFVTALEKVRGAEWQEGSAVFYALEIASFERFPAPDFLSETRPIAMALAYGTLILEFALPVLLYWGRTRRVAVVIAILMHLGFELFLELGFFGPSMIVGILAFVSPEDARRVLDLPGRMIRRFTPATAA